MWSKMVYIVFNSYTSEDGDGNWSGESHVDSVWTRLELAKNRLSDLSENYIEEQWSAYEVSTGVDYKEEWNEDRTRVTYSDQYSEDSFYIEEFELNACQKVLKRGASKQWNTKE